MFLPCVPIKNIVVYPVNGKTITTQDNARLGGNMEHEILTNSANIETKIEGKEVRETKEVKDNSYNNYKKKNYTKKPEEIKTFEKAKLEAKEVYEQKISQEQKISKTEETKSEEIKVQGSKSQELESQESKPLQITLPKKSKKKVLSVSPMHIVVEDKGSAVWIPGKFNVKVGDMVEV